MRRLEALSHEVRLDTRTTATLEAMAVGMSTQTRSNAARALDLRLRFSRGLRFLESVLDDVRLGFAREEGPLWGRTRREMRRVFTAPGHFIEPPELLSESLVGEFALAFIEKMATAKRSGLCIICGRVWIDTDGRGRRKLCGRDECISAHRQRKQRPEPTANVRARQQRFRLRHAPVVGVSGTARVQRAR